MRNFQKKKEVMACLNKKLSNLDKTKVKESQEETNKYLENIQTKVDFKLTIPLKNFIQARR